MPKSSPKITLHVNIVAKPHKLPALLDAVELNATATRREPGCEYYEVVQNIINPQELKLVEKFTNFDAFNAHFDNPVIRHFIDTVQHELVDSLIREVFITRVDSEGTRGQDEAETLPFRQILVERSKY